MLEMFRESGKFNIETYIQEGFTWAQQSINFRGRHKIRVYKKEMMETEHVVGLNATLFGAGLLFCPSIRTTVYVTNQELAWQSKAVLCYFHLISE